MKNLTVVRASASWRFCLTIVLALGARSFVSALTPPVQILLSENTKGTGAITALGDRLPQVAKAYGLTAQRLTTLLLTQPGLGVDRNGLLHFVCAAPAASAIATSSPTISAAPPSDPFRLHSFPGAQRIIYLDFDGHTTSGTHWNSNFTGGASIQSAPFDLDGSPGSFNTTEQEAIYRIWQRVAEDFAGFAIDVTTEDPGLEALRKSAFDDQIFGVRVVISPTNWYNLNAGGVGYVGSFDWSSDTPCFVFTAQLGQSEKPIAESASHEAGHTLRLYHDGSSSGDYFLGHGNWAPIMGAGYYRPVTQFSRGEYAGANNAEDDLYIISTYVPFATDDHGDTPESATSLSGTAVADGGTIERSTDVDVFRFQIPAGAVSFSVQGPSPEPNLDAQIELLNSAGEQLQYANPVDSLAATLNVTLPAGTYYLRIRGVGWGDPASTGYSNYGSIGNYVLTGTLPAIASNAPPTAVASASTTSGVAPLPVTFSSQGSTDPDGTIGSYLWNFGDGGTSTAANPSYTFAAPGTFTTTLTITDNAGLSSTASVAISVSPAPTGNIAPTFTLHPTNQSVTSGTTVTLHVAASGSPAPTFVWYRDGITFGSWTGASLTLYEVTANDVGTYTAVATNAAGSATSNPATLSIGTSPTPPLNPAVVPTITSQPISQNVAAGASATFSAAASGSPTPTLQWHHNGTAIVGATNSTLVLAAVTAAHAGNYELVATNSAGTATTSPATLTVTAPTGDVAPTITKQPLSATVASGGSTTFSVEFTGSPAPTVKWYRNGYTFPGWTSPTLALAGITANDVGTYTAVVTNSAGTITSAAATLTVVNPSGKVMAGP